jgi:parallel beta-helix repeat protein
VKTKLKSSIFIAIIITGMFAFIIKPSMFSVGATYVEGPIVQNTVWTLVDSPFVVSKNVTVYNNATLTIERGVEVRFGGDFSIIVEGQLIANGTQDRMITFTSNKYQPETGDWGSIEFRGARISLLAYCSVEYAKTGITMENSSVEIRNSVISNNSLSGVYISNPNQVTIQNNTIRSNADGILLNGTVSGINVSRNLVLSNTRSGIHLNLDAYSSLTILYNTLSANDKGFFISGNASTQITNNSISFNNVGFFYAAGQGHQAHWNDIYSNVMGMDAYYPTNKSVEVVDATYNYWGNASGPYHISLNPGGTGNPVGGDGVNIDFIFFLTAPIGYINQRPVARLLADKSHISPGQQVAFFATNSTDDRRVDQYFFDFGDEHNSGWTTLSVFVHNYSTSGTATVKVMDDFGVVSNNLASWPVTCQALPPLTVSLIPSSLLVDSGGRVSLAVQVTNATSPVDNADVILFSILGGNLSPASGLTNSSGYFTTTFSAPNVTAVTNIRIVASASKTGYADGSDYEYLMVQPPLIVSITANLGTIYSGATTNVTISVTCGGAPVSGATVVVSSNGTGSFDRTTGVTDANGTCIFVFTAPKVALITDIRVVASASKTGYADGSDYEYLTALPPLMVNITSKPDNMSQETASVTVRVTYNGAPVSAATVGVSSNGTGSFDRTTGVTDANGTCIFVFTAPQTSTQFGIKITAMATKSGYVDGQGQALLFVPGSAVMITKDTVWTLVDSPLVMSQDVIVYPNATLIVEPGVEVRFGGNFSLIVNGQLIANGLQNETIRFTSNKFSPQPGDWNGIVFSSVRPSQLAYCSIEYAKIGMNITEGVVDVKNSLVSRNSQDGIFVENSIATVEANEIIGNVRSGIYVTGSNNAMIQNNTVRSNGDGILLSGNVSSVNITQNVISLNTGRGIHLNGDAYNNVTILYNVLSANYIGFCVDGQASTYLTNNSVSYNTVGFSYESANHAAHWNDIYGNEMGMDVLSGATVDATYNYWGDPSGPYHVSLNPTGKGNPVGGDGVDLRFIFYLTAPIGYINQRPVARLLADKSHVSLGQQVTFFGTASTDDRRVDQYFFDFGDGQNSGWTTLSVFVHKYSSVGTYNATVKVMDDFGVVSNNIASLAITCQTLPPLTVSLIPNSAVVGSGGQVSVTVQVENATSPVGGASVTLFSILGGSFLSSSGETNSAGFFTTTFLAPNVTALTNIRIVASASKTGFADGSDYDYLVIQPPLMVNVSPSPDRIKSEANASVSVDVTYNGLPVSGANVTVWSNSTGSFDRNIGVTDTNGTCTFVFTAPQTTSLFEIDIAATATKSGYLGGQGEALLSVEPKVLVVQVSPSSAVVNSEMPSNVTVRVVYDGSPISNATVILSSDKGGSFSPTNATTDANGECTFVFTAPQTNVELPIVIVANATKFGYVSEKGETTITVTAEAAGGGWSVLTILLIIIPIIIAVVVVILIKLKIIVLSTEEGE